MKQVLIIGFLLFLCAQPAFAQSNDYNCDPFPDVPVNVTPVLGDATYDYSTSIGGLKALETSTPHFYERLLLGVTTFKPIIDINVAPKDIRLPDGRECVRITQVDVKIGYDDIVMHVASEIPQNSCGFNVVVAHEQRHVAVNQQIFQSYVPQIQQKLQDYLKENGVQEERNYGYIMTVMHDNMKKIVAQIWMDMNQQEQAPQQEVDANIEFQRMAQSCNGQLGLIAQQFRTMGK